MKEDIDTLDEIHKGACMGCDALNCVIDKVEDEEFKKELQKELDDYKNIADDIEEIYPKYNEGEPHKTNTMNKVMTWGEVEMNTLTDKSNSNIAELLLNGVNMGIVEGKRILNNKKLNKEVSDIVSRYVTMQENSVEALKEFL